MLSLTGEEGTGKSSVIASVAKSINMEPDSNRVLLYATCISSTAHSGHDQRRTADNILHIFLYHLYSRAVNKIDKDARLLDDCNAVFKNAKARFDRIPPQQRAGMSSLPGFVDGLLGLTSALKRDIVLVLDDVNKTTLDDATQEVLFQSLRQLYESAAELADNRIQILVGSSSSTLFSRAVEKADDIPVLDVAESNAKDLDLVLTEALRSVPGLSTTE